MRNVSMHAHNTWENFLYMLYMVNTTALTSSVFMAGARSSCMSWEQFKIGFPFCRRTCQSFVFFC